MNNDQIRLTILHQYYKAMFDGKGQTEIKDNYGLKDIPQTVINANLIWLIDKRLINGERRYASNGQVFAITSDITAWGMDVVESILNQSVEKLDPTITSEIKNETTTNKKFDKLYEMCVKVEPVFEIVAKVAGLIFTNLR